MLRNHIRKYRQQSTFLGSLKFKWRNASSKQISGIKTLTAIASLICLFYIIGFINVINQSPSTNDDQRKLQGLYASAPSSPSHYDSRPAKAAGDAASAPSSPIMPAAGDAAPVFTSEPATEPATEPTQTSTPSSTLSATPPAGNAIELLVKTQAADDKEKQKAQAEFDLLWSPDQQLLYKQQFRIQLRDEMHRIPPHQRYERYNESVSKASVESLADIQNAVTEFERPTQDDKLHETFLQKIEERREQLHETHLPIAEPINTHLPIEEPIISQLPLISPMNQKVIHDISFAASEINHVTFDYQTKTISYRFKPGQEKAFLCPQFWDTTDPTFHLVDRMNSIGFFISAIVGTRPAVSITFKNAKNHS